ncbi:MAG: isoamylase early set domain-containing protein [Leeuwenhoekiella sp.]
MSITKQFLKAKPICKVTFAVPAKEAEKVAVAGDFNNWEKEELKKQKNGIFKKAINIPADKSYEFRYIIDGVWANEADADGFIWNDFSASENCVLEL